MFDRDAILNTKFEADWKWIKQNKQKRIKKNNERETKVGLHIHMKKNKKFYLKKLRRASLETIHGLAHIQSEK